MAPFKERCAVVCQICMRQTQSRLRLCDLVEIDKHLPYDGRALRKATRNGIADRAQLLHNPHVSCSRSGPLFFSNRYDRRENSCLMTGALCRCSV